ncbi:MAG TPA: DEAD/DEAH box helicase [Candidatus Hydrogenedentes bacterium]|jgi:helicase|nr:MAG: ski2-like helicase [Candidatus Hydrogenedentes bacterium ADurb.Bin170]HOD96025.1 DEAD/DEAH box helicase [Candidatus Hydrogenedentota bacterium]HOR51530.1 DEAD/DEAH box helicase [Candidatus Hydrogenedentota bacterium]HPK24293.1 DEAD/DEAH box helicase [Candidatus Hydrogenedentota bacterium]HQB02716.1 DEAD/DEAH box helicase [Candidatus Hydrogenedentota bacterium]
MNITELGGYGIPASLISQWRTLQGEKLLPLQEKALRNFGLFEEGNLLVQAPTSSGKTFVGELAAVRAALAGKKSAFLLPLKALAEEKYREFCNKYEAYGIRTIICTRDHRRFDAAFEEGRYDMAIAVYEKLEQLAVTRPERLQELSLVIADELELLSDPERGAQAEVLLTRLLQEGVRIIGLSAVLGDPGALAHWLQARLLEQDRRPLELHYGVLFDGVYRYCGHNNPQESEERWESGQGDSSWSEVVHAVRRLADAGESCLVFVKARREACRGAELLARHLQLPAATEAREALSVLAPTRARNLLLQTLETGTAFHSADLLTEERRIVEEAFRRGEIRVLMATGTLAAGMNLPARNVFVSVEKWIYDPRLDLPWRAPISQGEFENMSGRAGRYNGAAEEGRAVLVATTRFERDALWQRYIKGQREPVQPRLDKASLDDAVLQLIASQKAATLEELTDFFLATLSARLVWDGFYNTEQIRFRVRSALQRCLEAGAVSARNEQGASVAPQPDEPVGALFFEAAPSGRVIAAKGVSLPSFRAILHWLRLSEQRDWYPLDLLVMLALLPDARLRQVPLSRREYEKDEYPRRMKEATKGQELRVDIPVNRLRNCRIMPFYDEARGIKTALFLCEWLEGAALETVEEHFDVSAGQITAAADQLAWLADATSVLAEAEGFNPAFVLSLRHFTVRLQFGIRDALVPLAEAVPSLTRNALLALAAEGLDTWETLHCASAALLERWMSSREAAALQRLATVKMGERETRNGKKETASSNDTAPLLVIDDRLPGQIQWQERIVPLQEKQYRLIRTLAAHPGECVAYDRVYRQIWGDLVVEENQMHYQKRMLLQRLEKADPAWKTLIRTIPKRGFMLSLPSRQVQLTRLPAGQG